MNPCAKTVKPEKAYEVWSDASGQWKWFVLKKYQTPEHEALNPYSRWHCAVQSPMTNGSFEYGDVYASNVKASPNHLIQNPLVPTTEQEKQA